jgi:hypothetical protein
MTDKHRKNKNQLRKKIRKTNNIFFTFFLVSKSQIRVIREALE